MSLSQLPWKSIAIVSSCVLVVANLLYLDYALIQQRAPKLSTEQVTTQRPSDVGCDTACVAEINDRIDALSVLPSPTTTSQTRSTATTATVKEYYIPLGTGSTTNNEWEDVTGAEITIDPANYPNIKEVHFEAGLRIPVANGTVTARLFNVTDQHPVWFSDVSAGTSTSTFASSGKITLDKGSKLYRVQIMSSLQYPAFMDMARIKIVVK